MNQSLIFIEEVTDPSPNRFGLNTIQFSSCRVSQNAGACNLAKRSATKEKVMPMEFPDSPVNKLNSFVMSHR